MARELIPEEYCIAYAKFCDQHDADYETKFQDLTCTSTSF